MKVATQCVRSTRTQLNYFLPVDHVFDSLGYEPLRHVENSNRCHRDCVSRLNLEAIVNAKE